MVYCTLVASGLILMTLAVTLLHWTARVGDLFWKRRKLERGEGRRERFEGGAMKGELKKEWVF